MSEQKPTNLDITILVPVKDEEECIPILQKEIEIVLNSLDLKWECLWIDDGSKDRTNQCLQEIRQQSSHHRIITLDQNYGQSASLWIGFKHAAGRLIVTMDGDLQNDPQDIPALLNHLQTSGVDMVNGIRAKRQDNLVRKISSRIGNGFRNWLTHEKVSDVGCSLRVFRKECISDLVLFKGMHRFIPTLVRMRGYTIAEIPVNHRQRRLGKTKYGIGNRLWVGIGDVLFVRWLQKRSVLPKIKSID